jgi:putative transposase
MMDTGHAALRRGRQSINGQAYLATFTTAHRKPHFRSDACAVDASRLLVDPEIWRQSRVLSWVLMPDHWHGIIEIGVGDELSACVRRLKGRTAFELRRRHPFLGAIWSTGYHDRAIRRESEMVAVARYLVLNPVRAGLVQRVGQYPYWDSIWV